MSAGEGRNVEDYWREAEVSRPVVEKTAEVAEEEEEARSALFETPELLKIDKAAVMKALVGLKTVDDKNEVAVGDAMYDRLHRRMDEHYIKEARDVTYLVWSPKYNGELRSALTDEETVAMGLEEIAVAKAVDPDLLPRGFWFAWKMDLDGKWRYRCKSDRLKDKYGAYLQWESRACCYRDAVLPGQNDQSDFYPDFFGATREDMWKASTYVEEEYVRMYKEHLHVKTNVVRCILFYSSLFPNVPPPARPRPHPCRLRLGALGRLPCCALSLG